MAKDNSSGFYVYVHRRATDGRVFYVGKGHGRRAWSKNGRNQYWLNVVNKYGYTVEIVQNEMQEWWAFELEREQIAIHCGSGLTNMSLGGEGPSGIKRSDATKKLMSERNSMRSQEFRNRVSMAKLGKKRPDMSLYPLHHRPGIREKVSGANNFRARAVICLDNGMRFDTATAASMWLRTIGYPKASNGDIVKCCKGKAYKSHKHRFAYAKEKGAEAP